jgi:hypothetical protein
VTVSTAAQTEPDLAADWPSWGDDPTREAGGLRLAALDSLPDPQLRGSEIGDLAEVDWYWVTRAAAEVLAAGADPRSRGEVWLLAEALLGASEAAHAAALILEPIQVTRTLGGCLYLDGRRRVAAMRSQGVTCSIVSVVDPGVG